MFCHYSCIITKNGLLFYIALYMVHIYQDCKLIIEKHSFEDYTLSIWILDLDTSAKNIRYLHNNPLWAYWWADFCFQGTCVNREQFELWKFWTQFNNSDRSKTTFLVTFYRQLVIAIVWRRSTQLWATELFETEGKLCSGKK